MAKWNKSSGLKDKNRKRKPMHPNSLKNLKEPWEKGTKLSGSKKGVPRARYGTIKRVLLAILDYDNERERKLQAMGAIKRARNGDLPFRTLRDTTDGPPATRLANADGSPLKSTAVLFANFELEELLAFREHKRKSDS